ncbi:hypothetical protein JXA80_04630, partial [bacterium]|nr:hypothetical protein [candidate division CSSED10-310 bacterium]
LSEFHRGDGGFDFFIQLFEFHISLREAAHLLQFIQECNYISISGTPPRTVRYPVAQSRKEICSILSLHHPIDL